MGTVDVVQAILNGDCDENMDAVRTALKQREQSLAVMLTATLKAGDKVRVKPGTIRPKYLEGEVLTVSRVSGGKVYGSFDNIPKGMRYGSDDIGLPQGTVERVAT